LKIYKNRQTLGAVPPDPHSLALDPRTSCLFPVMNSKNTVRGYAPACHEYSTGASILFLHYHQSKQKSFSPP